MGSIVWFTFLMLFLLESAFAKRKWVRVLNGIGAIVLCLLFAIAVMLQPKH